jgi:hypothetical protein
MSATADLCFKIVGTARETKQKYFYFLLCVNGISFEKYFPSEVQYSSCVCSVPKNDKEALHNNNKTPPKDRFSERNANARFGHSKNKYFAARNEGKTNGERNESLTLAQIQKTTPRSNKHEARRYVNICFENVYSIISKNVTFFSVKMLVY